MVVTGSAQDNYLEKRGLMFPPEPMVLMIFART